MPQTNSLGKVDIMGNFDDEVAIPEGLIRSRLVRQFGEFETEDDPQTEGNVIGRLRKDKRGMKKQGRVLLRATLKSFLVERKHA